MRIFAAISGKSAATVAELLEKCQYQNLEKKIILKIFFLKNFSRIRNFRSFNPPSIILIIYGVTVEESIAKLFIAGIIPGIGLAILFMTYVVIWSLKNKKIMPIISEDFSFLEKNKTIRTTVTCYSFNICSNWIYLCWYCYSYRSGFTWSFRCISIILFSK